MVMPARSASRRLLGDAPMRAHPVAPEPAGARRLEMASERPVGGEQQKALGIDVEPAHRDDPRQLFRQRLEHGLCGLAGPCGWSPAHAACCSARAAGLRVAAAPCRRPRRCRGGGHQVSRRGQHLAVHRDPASLDHPGSASRREQSPAWAIALAMRIGSPPRLHPSLRRGAWVYAALDATSRLPPNLPRMGVRSLQMGCANTQGRTADGPRAR